MKKTLAITCGLLAVALLAVPASADLSVVYEGSFNLPRTNTAFAHIDIAYYYPRHMAFVPDGTTRPDWGGTPAVTGPSLVIHYDGHGDNLNVVFEFNELPTLSKTSAGLLAASGLPNTSGGTEYGSIRIPSYVDSAGNFWDTGPSSAAQGMNVLSDPDPGAFVLGSSTGGTPASNETGWYHQGVLGRYQNGGVVRLGDGAGGDYSADGSAIGAHFLLGSMNGVGGGAGYNCYVSDNVRTSATAPEITSSLMFAVYRADFDDGVMDMDYIRDTGGSEHVVMRHYSATPSRPDADDNLNIYVFPSGTTGDVVRDGYAINIGAMATEKDSGPGAGWIASDSGGSGVQAIAVDWENSQLYVLDHKYYDARVHVFTFTPEPATMGLLGLGFAGMAALRRRRRK